MGLLEKLWDDTLAGPQPDSGLGRLRKFNTFHSRSIPSKETANGGDTISTSGENQEEVKISRKIMIIKPPGYNTQAAGSAPASPASPAGSTPPSSPFSGNRSGAFRFRRRSTSDTNEKAEGEDNRAFRNTPPPQDV